MTRAEQNRDFLIKVAKLIAYCLYKKIPVRLGEAHRPFFVAQKYFLEGIGITNSRHRYSQAIDIWITTDSGKDILWKDSRYQLLGIKWAKMGGVWGGEWRKPDIYHFELKEKPV